jgi:hypothetical protein
MLRRRLLSIVGAVGLVAALVSSGFAAQAANSSGLGAPAGALLASSAGAGNGDTQCSGTFDPNTGICTISQTTLTEDHSAVCVEDNVPGGVEGCVITQTSGPGFNNRAVVVQRYHENQGPNQTPCPTTQSGMQCATQTVTITQMATSGGSNFASVGQRTDQKLEPNTSGDQNQQDDQEVTIFQTSDSGQNQTDLDQSSKQNAKSNTTANQTQISREHGDITQFSSGLSTASANQDQDQRLAGNGSQTQQIDPKCCTTQISNPDDVFTIKQNANQQAESAGALQESSTVGECFSDGQCTIDQTATTNAGSQHNHLVCTPGTSCATGIVCTAAACTPCTPSEGGCFTGGAPVITSLSSSMVAVRGSVIASSGSASRYASVARSAPSGALLT